ncbi:hypothetical protein Vadar_002340 [Vaccinium darrowii]|uniref:Uncharacterized protein n=1 Tax=Vaccinium darrowii TaxID=229202 RepID=A0ACB7XN00_9ERIC|nr:hypothetical protein Vadar_002340 [Vaccinium darrowii]
MVSPRKGINVGRNKAPVTQHRLAVSSQDVGKNARKGPRVNWDSHLTRVFLELVVKEIEQVGRGTTQLSNQSLATISQRLTALTNLPVTPLQCKNRYQVLRRDWQAWQLLANAKKGAIGLGFDRARGTFTAPDFFWSNLIATRPVLVSACSSSIGLIQSMLTHIGAIPASFVGSLIDLLMIWLLLPLQNELVAKFRECPLDHEELMHRVFEEVTTTGNYVHILAEYDTDPANPIDLEDDSNIMGTNLQKGEEMFEGGGHGWGGYRGRGP